MNRAVRLTVCDAGTQAATNLLTHKGRVAHKSRQPSGFQCDRLRFAFILTLPRIFLLSPIGMEHLMELLMEFVFHYNEECEWYTCEDIYDELCLNGLIEEFDLPYPYPDRFIVELFTLTDDEIYHSMHSTGHNQFDTKLEPIYIVPYSEYCYDIITVPCPDDTVDVVFSALYP